MSIFLRGCRNQSQLSLHTRQQFPIFTKRMFRVCLGSFNSQRICQLTKFELNLLLCPSYPLPFRLGTKSTHRGWAREISYLRKKTSKQVPASNGPTPTSQKSRYQRNFVVLGSVFAGLGALSLVGKLYWQPETVFVSNEESASPRSDFSQGVGMYNSFHLQ